MSAHLPKINLLALLLAAGCFALPWLSMQCSDREVMTQTGLQTIYGGMTLSPEFRDMADDSSDADDEDDASDRPGPAWLVGGAAVATLLGLAGAGVQVFRRPDSRMPGLLAALALGLLIAQLVVGFPAERELAEARREALRDDKSEDASAAIGQLMGASMAMQITTQRLPWAYVPLGLLGVPVLITVFHALPTPPSTGKADEPAAAPPA
jgi:hypothetical protein